MITGLHIDIKTAELTAMLLERYQHHLNKADLYAKQTVELEKLQEELKSTSAYNNSSTRDPVEEAAQAAKRHRKSASTYRFLAEHLVPDEVYRLTQADLNLLGLELRTY